MSRLTKVRRFTQGRTSRTRFVERLELRQVLSITPAGDGFVMLQPMSLGSVDISIDGEGDTVIAWSAVNGPSQGVWARRFDSAGTQEGPDILVSDKGVGVQVAMDHDGDFVVAWKREDLIQDYYGNVLLTSVQTQRFRADGSVAGPPTLIDFASDPLYDPDVSELGNPELASDAAGNYLIAWERYYYTGGAREDQIVTFVLGTSDGSFGWLGQGISFATQPRVAMERNGGFAFAYNEFGNTLAYGYDNNLVPLGYPADYLNAGPDVALGSNLELMLYENGTGTHLRISPDGSLLPTLLLGPSVTLSEVAYLPDNSILVLGSGGVQWFDPDGTLRDDIIPFDAESSGGLGLATDGGENILFSEGAGGAIIGRRFVFDDARGPRIQGIALADQWGQQFNIPTGSGEQLRTVPLGNASEISIAFAEDISADIADMTLTGEHSGISYPAGFTYDTLSHTATWHFSVLPADRWTIELNADGQDPITNGTGNPLDGEWDNPVSLDDPSASTISGDGIPGGDFVFRFTLLPGDANRDNQVTGADYSLWADNFGQPNAAFEQGDFTGDGQLTPADYTIWADNFGIDLTGSESAEPAAVPAGGPYQLGVQNTELALRLLPEASRTLLAAANPKRLQIDSDWIAPRVDSAWQSASRQRSLWKEPQVASAHDEALLAVSAEGGPHLQDI